MVRYTKDEIQASSSVSRNFGSILDKLKKKKLEKIAVMRNNRLEAVILPIEDYEKMNELEELQEQLEIYKIVKEREKIKGKSVSFDSVIEEYGIKEDEL